MTSIDDLHRLLMTVPADQGLRADDYPRRSAADSARAGAIIINAWLARALHHGREFFGVDEFNLTNSLVVVCR